MILLKENFDNLNDILHFYYISRKSKNQKINHQILVNQYDLHLNAFKKENTQNNWLRIEIASVSKLV